MPTAPAAVYSNEVFHFGGMYTKEGLTKPIWYGVVEAYDRVTNRKRTMTNMPQALRNMAVAVHGDTMFLFGGFYGAAGREAVQTDLIAYHLPADKWINSRLGTLPEVRLFGYQSAVRFVDGRRLWAERSQWAWDETDVEPVTDVLVYDVASGQFSRETNLPEPRSDHAVLFHDGHLYVINAKLSTGNTGETLRLRV